MCSRHSSARKGAAAQVVYATLYRKPSMAMQGGKRQPALEIAARDASLPMIGSPQCRKLVRRHWQTDRYQRRAPDVFRLLFPQASDYRKQKKVGKNIVQ